MKMEERQHRAIKWPLNLLPPFCCHGLQYFSIAEFSAREPLLLALNSLQRSKWLVSRKKDGVKGGREGRAGGGSIARQRDAVAGSRSAPDPSESGTRGDVYDVVLPALRSLELPFLPAFYLSLHLSISLSRHKFLPSFSLTE